MSSSPKALTPQMRTAMACVLCLFTMTAQAEIPTISPVVDTRRLPAIENKNTDYNPYRGHPDAIAAGRDAFNQSCAVCHGMDADGSRMPAPDLRRIGRSCNRLVPGEWKRRCESDADFYFKRSVEEGKVKVGVRHMPAWKDLMSLELIWAIRSFVESARPANGGE